VGESYEINPGATLTEHWNGSACSLVATPALPDSNDDFNGAAATSSTDVWGVG